ISKSRSWNWLFVRISTARCVRRNRELFGQDSGSMITDQCRCVAFRSDRRPGSGAAPGPAGLLLVGLLLDPGGLEVPAVFSAMGPPILGVPIARPLEVDISPLRWVAVLAHRGRLSRPVQRAAV